MGVRGQPRSQLKSGGETAPRARNSTAHAHQHRRYASSMHFTEQNACPAPGHILYFFPWVFALISASVDPNSP